MNSSLDHPELYAFESLHDRAVSLTPDQIQQAHLDSQNAPAETAWQCYCDRLAHFGLVNWLAENNLSPEQDSQQDSSQQDLVVRDFTVRSQFVSASEDEFVTVGRSSKSSSSEGLSSAHFYVLATVAEEQSEVWISGFLTQEQMAQQVAKNKSENPLAEIPISAFNPKMESFLLAVRTTEAVALIKVASGTASGAIDRAVVNLRTWLSRQWKETLETLEGGGWEPLGQALPSSALRGDSVAALPQILQSLARKGIRLAGSNQGMSRILPIGPIPLRLYVMPGEATVQQEWEMLVVLESASDEPMPSGLVLRISDDQQVLLEQTFDPQATTDRSLFAEVVSGLEESVFVDIVLPNGKVHSLPKFVFQDV
jgi:Protein of unknown function (DUF1822)